MCKFGSQYETCGNNIKEIGEECDGTDLGGLTCSDFGYHHGNLSCQNCFYDTTNCSEYPGENCTDNIDNDLDGYVDCQDPDCALHVDCLPENCQDRTFCGQCILDGQCTWCHQGQDGSGCYADCKKGRHDNCFKGTCYGSSCP